MSSGCMERPCLKQEQEAKTVTETAQTATTTNMGEGKLHNGREEVEVNCQ